MLVGKWPLLSLAWARQEARRKICTSAAEQSWTGAFPDNVLAMMGKNQCFEGGAENEG